MLASINWWNHNKRFFCLLVLLSNVIGSYASIVDYDDEHESESQDQMLRNDHSVDPKDYEQSSRFKHRLHLPSLRADNQEDKLLKLERRLEQECGRYSSQPYISNGRGTRPGEFPSYVFTWQREDHDEVCGGTILDRTHILTAANCYNKRYPVSSIRVEDTCYNRSNLDIVRHSVKKVCLADYIDGDVTSPDIAVYELSKPLEFNEYLQSACLPRGPLDGEQATFLPSLGFTDNTWTRPYDLRVWPMKEEKCPHYADHHTNICFSHGTLDFIGYPCDGDTGGGALSIQDEKMRVFGVLSEAKYMPCTKGRYDPAIFKNTLLYKRDILQLILDCTST